jgi:uncharacterized repeat protein (TIGR03803 family)
MARLNAWKWAGALFLLCAVALMHVSAQTFKTLATFGGVYGANPADSVTQATDGNLYGTTTSGNGTAYHGTVFRMTRAGKLTTLYSFCSKANCTDGAPPQAALVQATNGNLYGTTFGGGAPDSWGTLFRTTLGGKLTTLYTLCAQGNCADGASPYAALIQAADGNLYGTTQNGGITGGNCGYGGCGTAFKITPTGQLSTVYTFCSKANCADGALPQAALVQAANGNLYGTTFLGGANNAGTVFQITQHGTLTTVYSFGSVGDGLDGIGPRFLLQALDGNFYGVTAEGGSLGYCSYGFGCGTVFKLTPRGKLTTLYSFCPKGDCTPGFSPSGLLQATDGNFYGTTTSGGAGIGGGTIYKITPSGAFRTLHSFCRQTNCTDGADPSGLSQVTDGNFYGTTWGAGELIARALRRVVAQLSGFQSALAHSSKHALPPAKC